MITQSVVDKCGLVATGMTVTHGVHGPQSCETFLVNILLPNHVTFVGIRVTKGLLAPGSDILIGMDIMNLGDFAVTNHGGITKFSFRTPSQRHIDFVAEQATAQPRVTRPQYPNAGRAKAGSGTQGGGGGKAKGRKKKK